MNLDKEKYTYINKVHKLFPFEKIKSLLEKLKPLRVLVVGDTILDEYVFVHPKGRAMKDPILSTEFRSREVYAGGILAIANHISSFVDSLTVVTLLGDQEPQREFVEKSLAANAHLKGFIKPDSPTLVKKRYIDGYKNNKLFKVEYINDKPIPESLSKEIGAYLEKELPLHDLAIIGDFGHGFLNPALREILQKAKFTAVMCQSNSANMGYNYFTQYTQPGFLVLNDEELRLPFGRRFDDIEEVTRDAQEKLGCKKIIVTLGKNGCLYADQGVLSRAPIMITSVKDTVGAGDAVFAIGSLCAFAQAEPELLPFIANCAGGIAANIMGNKEPVSREKLLKFIEEIYALSDSKEVHEYLSSVGETLAKLNKGSVSACTKLMMDTYHNEGTIYAFGNGGSAATASHFCGDLIKGVSYGLEKRFRAICLNDNLPALMAIANDISYDDIFIEQLKNFLKPGDLVIGISGSGNSKNVVKALTYAKEKGARTIAVCGFGGGKIKEIADLSIHAEIDDMEISEDIHNLVIIHCVKRMLQNELNNHTYGEQYVKRQEYSKPPIASNGFFS